MTVNQISSDFDAFAHIKDINARAHSVRSPLSRIFFKYFILQTNKRWIFYIASPELANKIYKQWQMTVTEFIYAKLL